MRAVLGTFGSFIGLPQVSLLIKSQFPNVNPLATLAGPAGGCGDPSLWWLAVRQARRCPRHAGNFIVMAIAVVGVTGVLPSAGNEGQFGGFFVCFLVLFLTTGIGNGSTFRMIPSSS